MVAATILNSLYHLLSIFDVEALIRYGGLLMLCLLIYGNTGLFFCFFLPTGPVLFGAGVFVATGALDYDILTVCSLLIAAAVLGNLTGYWFGHKAGPSLYRRKDSRFFRRQYLIKTEEFYKKHGSLAIIAGIFLPIIRTFSPIVAGVIGLKFQRFIIAMLAGCFLWVPFFVFTGYFMGNRPWLKPWLKYIVIAVILFITVPIVIRLVKESRKAGKENGGTG
jgi:membrane-associated protein